MPPPPPSSSASTESTRSTWNCPPPPINHHRQPPRLNSRASAALRRARAERRLTSVVSPDFVAEFLIQFSSPGRDLGHVGRQAAHTKVHWTDQNVDVLNAGLSGKDEQVFRRRVAHSQAANRCASTVDHDIRTQLRSTIQTPFLAIEGVGVVQAQR